jgi:4-azaleucine resistance transporter AzlC
MDQSDAREGWRDVGRGLLVGVPIALGYGPIAFSFGVAATRAGLSGGEAVALSVLMYSGAAQFMALALLAAGTSFAVAFVTLVAMSLRHVLYGPSLLRAGGGAGLRWASVWGFGLTDEVFGASLGALARGGRLSDGFMMGLSLLAYGAWVTGTALGALAGGGALQAWPALDAGLGFMLTALFIALLLSITRRAALPAIGVAGAAALVLGALVSPTAGILGGMILGAAVGTFGGRLGGRSAR